MSCAFAVAQSADLIFVEKLLKPLLCSIQRFPCCFLQFDGEPLPHSKELIASRDPVEQKRCKEFEDYVKHKAEKEKSELYKIVKEKVLGNTVVIGEGAHRQAKRSRFVGGARVVSQMTAVHLLLCRRSAREKGNIVWSQCFVPTIGTRDRPLACVVRCSLSQPMEPTL
jgi:hypothetical protein